MTENAQPEPKPSTEPAKKPEPEKEGGSLLTAGGVGGIASGLMALLGMAAGAGWPGVIALAGLGLTAPLGIWALIRVFNSWSDKRDLERAGADAGNTAVDLANQGKQVGAGLDSAQKLDPPTDGYPKQ